MNATINEDSPIVRHLWLVSRIIGHKCRINQCVLCGSKVTTYTGEQPKPKKYDDVCLDALRWAKGG